MAAIFRHQSLSGPEYEVMQEQIDTLTEQLDESKYEQDKQRRLIQQLKDVRCLSVCLGKMITESPKNR